VQSRVDFRRLRMAAEIKRVGMVIGLKEERSAEYFALHAPESPGVRKLLKAANMRNFSIFVTRFPDNRLYLFGYYEYVGSDFDSDQSWLAEQIENRAWLAQCDPMQSPLSGSDSWQLMDTVYFNE